ncbi:UNVERIFIED_CONTAM: hypothetical protein FKN15_032371 [Acipenser sinensis]
MKKDSEISGPSLKEEWKKVMALMFQLKHCTRFLNGYANHRLDDLLLLLCRRVMEYYRYLDGLQEAGCLTNPRAEKESTDFFLNVKYQFLNGYANHRLDDLLLLLCRRVMEYYRYLDGLQEAGCLTNPRAEKESTDNKGALVSLSPRLAAQCGYSLTVDFLGNAKFLASVLSCFAQNTATAADNSIWKIVFHLPANRKTTMTVAQAMTNGYGINTTPTRILVRAAYNSTESQSQGIQTVPMAVLRSTTFYKQRWMVMMVDTAVACPTDGTAFTEQMITWNVPRVLPPLVPTPQITTLDVQMGVDGRKLDPATIHNRDYKLDVGPQLITVKIPVGADGGYYKSHVLDNTYVISYSIEPMLEHTWQDGPEKTKYTVLHPITTPFMPRPPVVTNNTVPKARVFNVTLGTFLPDVELVKIIVGPETLTVPEANLKGYNVQEHVFPNGSKTYTLQVPFEDPNVKQKVTPPDTRTYILPLTYLLNIVPENTPFTHPAVVEAILKDIIPPTVTGYCDGAAFYTMVTYGNMGRNWVPFVGSRELGGSLLALYKYNANATNFWMTVPYNSVDATYESHVLDNTYVISCSIEPMLEHTWQDGPEKTKYTVLHPITTPFMPRPPVVTNNTVPKARVFNVTLGTFLPDVELVKIIVGPETLTVPEANLKGYNVQEHVFPNGSKTYTLQVPFEDPNVKQKVTPPDTRTYILPLTYLLNIVPENTPFTHPAVVEAILKDIIPPTVTGYCDGAAFYTMVTYGNMGRNWVPFVGSRELGGSLLALYKYNANATNFWMTVPYNSVDATYEVISSLGIRSRLDLTLKDIGTMVVVADFSLSCSFPTKMIDCFTNGTMAALAVKVESVPSLSPSQLTLRDPSCRPLQSDATNAVFYFNVNSCGTTRRFDNNLLTYENEVLFTSYRLRVACHYLVNDTKVVQFLYQNNPAPVVQPGLGDLAVIMRLALDSTYNDFYGAQDYPVVKYLRRPLYFEVELLYSRDPQAELFLENCWATYSADRNSSPKWDVVVDSCENSADEYLTIFHPVSSNARVLFPSHLKRFEVKMFSFTSGRDALKGQIYFHCSVVICDSNRPSDSLCSRRCIPGKQRLGKSSVCWGEGGDILHAILSISFDGLLIPPVGRSAEGMDGGAVKAFVSSGPIELKRDGSLRFMPRSGNMHDVNTIAVQVKSI